MRSFICRLAPGRAGAMPPPRRSGKLYGPLTVAVHTRAGESARVAHIREEDARMAGLAMVMFIALFAFGSSYFGWEDVGGRVSLALFAAYIFGVICGYRVNK